MILAEAILVGLILSLVTGGSLRKLAEERLRGEWILLVLLPIQMFWPRVSELLSLSATIAVGAWLLMMVALIGVLLVNIRSRWVLGIAALGIALNALVIGLNGAMPVSMRSVSELGVPRDEAVARLEVDHLHKVIDEETTFEALADVVTIPGPEWQRAVVSVGDLLLGAGLAGWAFVASRQS